MRDGRDSNARVVLAIDPGKCKCGVAVVSKADDIRVLHRAVVDTESLPAVLSDLASRFSPDTIILGDGTTSKPVADLAGSLGMRVEVVDEKMTSVLARKRYFQENAPKGLRRLIPISFQTPSTPCDDYVAVILAERYFADNNTD